MVIKAGVTNKKNMTEMLQTPTLGNAENRESVCYRDAIAMRKVLEKKYLHRSTGRYIRYRNCAGTGQVQGPTYC